MAHVLPFVRIASGPSVAQTNVRLPPLMVTFESLRSVSHGDGLLCSSSQHPLAHRLSSF